MCSVQLLCCQCGLEHVSPIKVYCQLVMVVGGGIIGMQHVRKGCREFANVCMTSTMMIRLVI
jgi:hypothetical protein